MLKNITDIEKIDDSGQKKNTGRLHELNKCISFLKSCMKNALAMHLMRDRISDLLSSACFP